MTLTTGPRPPHRGSGPIWHWHCYSWQGPMTGMTMHQRNDALTDAPPTEGRLWLDKRVGALRNIAYSPRDAAAWLRAELDRLLSRDEQQLWVGRHRIRDADMSLRAGADVVLAAGVQGWTEVAAIRTGADCYSRLLPVRREPAGSWSARWRTGTCAHCGTPGVRLTVGQVIETAAGPGATVWVCEQCAATEPPAGSRTGPDRHHHHHAPHRRGLRTPPAGREDSRPAGGAPRKAASHEEVPCT